MRSSDALVIMKTGRNLAKFRRALEAAGRLDDAWLIERGTMPGERVARLPMSMPPIAPISRSCWCTAAAARQEAAE